MAIELIDKIKQKNAGTFKLMDAADVDYDGSGSMSVKQKLDDIAASVESGISDEDFARTRKSWRCFSRERGINVWDCRLSNCRS